MAILKGNPIPIVRQEGDNTDLEFQVPIIVPLTGATAHFQVRKKNGELLLDPSTTIAGQIITILLLPEDTIGKSGSHNWELEIRVSGVITTIAAGPFTIVKELVK